MDDRVHGEMDSGPTGVVFDIKRFAVHDGPGIRTTVFLKGCPLTCPWCHNPESREAGLELSQRVNRCIVCGRCATACPHGAIEMTADGPVTDLELCRLDGRCAEACPSGAREMVGRSMTVDEVVKVAERDRVFYEESGGGVTFSGGEPLAQPEFLVEALRRCRSAGLHTALDTTLHAPREVVDAVAPHSSLFLVDVKHADSVRHQELTGADNQLILGNLRHVSTSGRPIVIRIPLVAGVNDDRANIAATGKLAASLGTVERIDLLPYIEGGPIKARRLVNGVECERFERPSRESVAAAREILETLGLSVSVGG